MLFVVHEAASTGYGRRADAYQRARPTYHPCLIERFVARYVREPVLELGAGTGAFTAELVDAGVRVVAVEPVAEMRSFLHGRIPSVAVVGGVAEALPFSNGCAGTVVAAQAFHWFEHGVALEEIHRVLHAGGLLVTAWNVRDTSVEWMAEYDEILAPYSGTTPRHSSLQWRAAIDADARFHLIDDWGIDHPQRATVEDVVERALSTSFIAALPAPQQDDVVAKIRRLLQHLGHSVAIPYRSELQVWRAT